MRLIVQFTLELILGLDLNSIFRRKIKNKKNSKFKILPNIQTKPQTHPPILPQRMSAFDIDSDIGLNKAASGASAPKLILPFLYVGNALTANEKGFLKRDGIQVVLDVSNAANFVEFKHKKEYEYIAFHRGSAPVQKDGDDEDDSDDDDDGDDDGEVEEDVQAKFKELYEILKKIKAKNQKVLLYSTDYTWVCAVVASYMLQSSKALDKYLPLAKALEFMATKDVLLKPDEHLLELVVLEEELFEEVSVKLPSNSRGKKGTIRKGGAKKGGRR